MQTAQRNIIFDELKGIGILLVILGHCLPWNSPFRVFIYSFHMPLFFIVAGYFLKPSPPMALFKKDFRRLVVPYIAISIVILVSNTLKWYIKKDFSLIDSTIIPLLWGAGGGHTLVMVFDDVQPITQLWFLLALFWSRLVANLLPRSIVGVLYGLIISVIGTIVGRYVIFLPGGINEGLSALIYVMIGVYVKEKGVNRDFFYLSIVCWIISLIFFDMILAGCKYDCYPIQVLGGVGGTFLIYKLLKRIDAIDLHIHGLSWLGINSMAMLCMHTIESHTIVWSILHIKFNMDYYIIVFIIKIFFCIGTTLLLAKLEFTRKMFLIKT